MDRIRHSFDNKTFFTEHTSETREFAIEAAIVKIMKSRQRLKFNDLSDQVYNQLKLFKPNTKVRIIILLKKLRTMLQESGE